MAYYTAETGYGTSPVEWVSTKAKSASAAKRLATQRQAFQGSDLYVGRRACDGSIYVVARKLHRSALDMSAAGTWQDVAI